MAAVPTAGIVTKVGIKVPIILPIVFNAPSSPTVFPLSFKLSTENLTRDGVTVPSKINGNTNTTKHVTNDAQIKKFLVTNVASKREIPMIKYLPANGIAAVQIAAMRSRI